MCTFYKEKHVLKALDYCQELMFLSHTFPKMQALLLGSVACYGLELKQLSRQDFYVK
jgi:hypothetical protein